MDIVEEGGGDLERKRLGTRFIREGSEEIRQEARKLGIRDEDSKSIGNRAKGKKREEEERRIKRKQREID